MKCFEDKTDITMFAVFFVIAVILSAASLPFLISFMIMSAIGITSGIIVKLIKKNKGGLK